MTATDLHDRATSSPAQPSVTFAPREAPTGAEAARLRALARYSIIDTPRDDAFDEVAELARRLTGSPVAGIAFYELDRVWFKALLGAEVEGCTLGSSEQSHPDRHGAAVVTALESTVGGGDVASVPCVTSDGYALGCVFVAGFAPSSGLTEDQLDSLASLARQVVRLLELRRTLLSYHTVVDGAGHVVFHLDQADCLVSLTPTWSQLSGFGLVRSVGKALSGFVHPEDQDRVSEWLQQVRVTAVPPVVECRLLRLARDPISVEILARPLIDERDQARGVVGVIADVSERHAREVEAQHLQRLEALGRLSAGLAHEINTPIQFVGDNARFLAESSHAMLTLIEAYRRVLQENGDSQSPQSAEIEAAEAEADLEFLTEEVPSAVQQTLDGVGRVALLVQAMKTFSHPGASDQAEADLNEALRATMTVARNRFKYIAEEEVDLDDLPPVVCNVADLNQVFLNLVINAADAIEETGQPGRITIKTVQDGDDVVITVSDTGVGVPEDLKRRIFEPFFTTKAVGRGTGQGLALVRAVTEQHCGTVALNSKPGVGSTFTIRLPIQGCPRNTEDPS
jgi:PAS domain S-box-containing protein